MGRYFGGVQLVTAVVAMLWHSCSCQILPQYCRFTPQHTLCKTKGLGDACGMTAPRRGVSEEDAAVIMGQHNQLRARVALGRENKGAPGHQPAAANMMQLMWDEELSLVAQRHADQCIFEHECGDCRRVDRFAVGQNLFISFQSDLDATIHWPRAMQAWYDEVELFSANDVDSYNFDPATGHYTQFVWAKTSLIGCGFTMFEEGGWYKKLYTCNYGQTGNIIFRPMYQRGDPCSSCPQGTSCSLAYPGLCVSNTSPSSATPGQGLGNMPGQNRINRRNPGRRNNRRRNQGQSNFRMSMKTGSKQPFQILQPFQLLQASGLTSSAMRRRTTSTPRSSTATAIIKRQQRNRVQQLMLRQRQRMMQQRRQQLIEKQQQLIQKQQQQQQQQEAMQQQQQKALDPVPSVTLEETDGLPQSENLQTFLSNFGKTSQVIRTNSLASVKAIINSLPHDTRPLVFFRSHMGTVRQLSNLRLAGQTARGSRTPRTRTIRSTVTPAKKSPEQQMLQQSQQEKQQQKLDQMQQMMMMNQQVSSQQTDLTEQQPQDQDENGDQKTGNGDMKAGNGDMKAGNGDLEVNLEDMLLSCQDVGAPCPVVALLGNWTHGRGPQTNVVRTLLTPSMGGQLVLGQTIPPPASSAACVTLSYNYMTDGDDATLLPQLQVAVWPLGQVLLQEDLDEVSMLQEDGWLRTQVSFAPIRNPFMVVLSVEPNPGPQDVEVALRGFMVTEGLC
uniref:Cell wall protein PRY3-like n=1 Tax=Hirondellea gigas TaxID=1518452 RepID=A0A6A7FVL3_9CRUS